MNKKNFRVIFYKLNNSLTLVKSFQSNTEMINQSKMSFYASANTNRERHQKYNHPKGAPDVDLIFGGAGSAINVGFNSNKRHQNNASNSPNSANENSNFKASDTNRNFQNNSLNSNINTMK